jgi:hypothetical protein
MSTTRAGALTTAEGAKGGMTRAARSAEAQNKASSKSVKDICEGREKVGQNEEADKGEHI